MIFKSSFISIPKPCCLGECVRDLKLNNASINMKREPTGQGINRRSLFRQSTSNTDMAASSRQHKFTGIDRWCSTGCQDFPNANLCVCMCVWECVGSTQRGGWNCQPQNPAVSEWMKKKREEKWAEKVPKGYPVLLHIQIHRMRVTQTHTTLVNCVGAVSWGFYSVICGGKIDITDHNMALNREGVRRLGGERLDSGSEFQLIFAEIRWQLCLCLTSGQRKGVKEGERSVWLPHIVRCLTSSCHARLLVAIAWLKFFNRTERLEWLVIGAFETCFEEVGDVVFEVMEK